MCRKQDGRAVRALDFNILLLLLLVIIIVIMMVRFF